MFFASALFAQGDTLTTHVLYLSRIPLLIESGIHKDSLDHGTFQTIGNWIRIWQAGRKVHLDVDQVMRLGRPLSRDSMRRVEWAWDVDDRLPANWQLLPAVTGSGPLLEMPFGAHRELHLVFRDMASKSVIQRNNFERYRSLPHIAAYRLRPAHDSTDDRIKSTGLSRTNKVPPGYQLLDSTDRLEIPPGQLAEILLKKTFTGLDSAIEYRLRPLSGDDASGPWRRTGVFLPLEKLAPHSRYLLELRYVGAADIQSYQLVCLPAWYQTTSGKGVSAALLIVILTATPWLVYRYRLAREREKRNRIHEQLTTVQNRLNPHFVYNALNSIEGLIASHDNDRANEFLSGFSDIMRQTLRHSMEVLVTLSDDLEMLEKYIRIEQLRFEFAYRVSIDTSLVLQQIDFPPMLLQPIVENAVKHGLAGMGAGGRLDLRFERDGRDLLIRVADNGLPKEGVQGDGYGTRFTRERLAQVKRLYRKKHITYSQRQSPEGFVAEFTFQNWLP